MNEKDFCRKLIEQQQKLKEIQKSLELQKSIQESLTTEISQLSTRLMEELRFLSLVRLKVVQSEFTNTKKLLRSQTFTGLVISNRKFDSHFLHPVKQMRFNFLLIISEKIFQFLQMFFFSIALNFLIRGLRQPFLYFCPFSNKDGLKTKIDFYAKH
jgi:hypothetical protein